MALYKLHLLALSFLFSLILTHHCALTIITLEQNENIESREGCWVITFPAISTMQTQFESERDKLKTTLESHGVLIKDLTTIGGLMLDCSNYEG